MHEAYYYTTIRKLRRNALFPPTLVGAHRKESEDTVAHEIRTIACLGSGKGKLGEPMYDEMTEVGRLLTRRKIMVVTGAYGGSGMEAPARGACEAEGTPVGYTLGGKRGNEFVRRTVDCNDVAQRSGADWPHADFGLRLTGLMSADGFILDASGGIGTFLEFITFVLFATKFWQRDEVTKRLAILDLTDTGHAFDSGMLNALVTHGLVDKRVGELMAICRTPEEAVCFVTWKPAPR